MTTSRACRAALLYVAVTLAGCASIAQRAASDLAADLERGIYDHDDPATVAEGLPAYLLLLDGLISSRPDNSAMLQAAAGLYTAYAGNFVDEPARARRLATRGWWYARRAACIELPIACERLDGQVDAFQQAVDEVPADRLAVLYTLGTAWAGYIQVHSNDWAAIAALPKAQRVIERVVELDPDYQRGMPWAYLGVLHSLRPAAVGGQPERGRDAFEQAIARSGGANLMAQVLYAEHYAKLLFDRELHDRLLQAVRAANPKQPGFTLSNTLAQQRAEALLAAADEYF